MQSNEMHAWILWYLVAVQAESAIDQLEVAQVQQFDLWITEITWPAGTRS